MSVTSGSASTFYLYYYRSERLREVTRRVFDKTCGPIFASGVIRVRVIDCNSRSKAYSKIKKWLSLNSVVKLCNERKDVNFYAQSLFDDATDVYLGSKLVVKVLKMLGKLKKRVKGKEVQLVISLVKLFLEIYTIVSGEFCFIKFSQVILSIYSLHETLFEAQSLDVLLLAGISAVLPPKLANLLRTAQLLTQSKIGDDLSLINQLIAAILSLCEFLLSKIPNDCVIKPYFDKMFGFFKNNTAHVWITQVERALKEVEKTPIKLGNETYREQLLALNKKLEETHEILDWSRRSAALQSILNRWKNLMRVVRSYGQPDRQEPNCFVFEGPPGTMKSCVLNSVIMASGQTCYSHLVKSAMDGKDWYDAYNNEEIFYMDDVGQQGVSQWRTIINMVSCIKYPLECAEASLKDTKFFNSPTILLTTNQFQNLSGLTKQDCISDIKALWRRGYVFDFKGVVRHGNFIKGKIQFKYFDINTDKFESNFPSVFIRSFPNISHSFEIDVNDANAKNKLVSWVLSIVLGFAKIKNEFLDNNRMTSEEAANIRRMAEQLQATGRYEAQGKFYKPEIYDAEFEDLIDEEIKDMEFQALCRDARFDQTSAIMSAFAEEERYERDSNAEVQGNFFSNKYNSNFDTTYNCATEVGHRNLVVAEIVDVREEEKPWYHNFIACLMKSAWCVQVFMTYCKHAIEDFIEREPEKFGNLVGFGLVAASVLLIWIVNKRKSNATVDVKSKQPIFQPQSWRDDFKFDDKKLSSSVLFLQKSVKEVELFFGNSTVKGFGVVSGRHVIVPKHFVHENEGSIIIYLDKDRNHRLVDNELFMQEWSSNEEDVAVLSLPKSFPSPFPNICNFLTNKYCVGLDCLVNNYGVKMIHKDESVCLDRKYTYVHALNDSKFVNSVGPKDITYNVQGVGLCGSIVVNSTGGVLGMHVAGDPRGNTGVALRWSDLVKQKIRSLLESDKNILPWSVSNRVFNDFSAVKLEGNLNSSVPTTTNFGPSPLYGIYPVTRTPAQLTKFGKCTVKDVAKKSFKPVVHAPLEEIEFGKQVIRSFLKPFSALNEETIVKGNLTLAGLNKNSSNGYGCEKEKSVYVDFDNGVLTDKCRKELVEVEESIINGNPQWNKFLWVESLKDELRNDEKDGVPRSFRIGTIHQQILVKKYFGAMVEDLIKTRDFHQIMVGMNPFLEWPSLYDRLRKCQGVFAGDVKEWDGRMLSQVQRAVAEVILSFVEGDKIIPSFLLETVIHSLVIVQDDLYLTTHSFPSGSFLTAIFNSIVNKFYTAMWFYREMKNNGKTPNVKLFWDIVVDFVYGDDKLNGVKKYGEFLNALTLRDFFLSFNMSLTTANKGEIVAPFESLEDLTFLKRSFRYHNKLNRIVCPLELRTLYSGLSFVDASKDLDVVMDGKVSCFQREIYLHPDRESLLEDFIMRLKRYPNFKVSIFPENYLLEIYKDPNCILDNFLDVYI